MNANGIAGEKSHQGVLTDKQCRVLDLLIEHKTSKEIARELGISPYTVDQRISLARAKLGVSSRNELAARYRVMRKTPGQLPSYVAAHCEGEQLEEGCESDAYGSPSFEADQDPLNDRAGQRGDDLIVPGVSAGENIFCPTNSKVEYRVGPEVFEGSSGGWWRLGAVVATALLLVMTILVLFAIYDQLNDMLA